MSTTFLKELKNKHLKNIEMKIELILRKVARWTIARDMTGHIIVWIATPILISFLPIIAFLIYMHECGIFSYDFFINGSLGLNTFFIISAFFTLIFGLITTGSIIQIIAMLSKKMRDEKIKIDDWLIFIYLLIVNVMVCVTSLKVNFELESIRLLTLVGFALNLHIGMILFGRGKLKFVSLIVFISIVIPSLLFFHKSTASLIMIGMQKFNTGGNANVAIYNESNNTVIISKGDLVLLSPENIYIQTGDGIEIMQRNNKIIKFIDQNTDQNQSGISRQ